MNAHTKTGHTTTAYTTTGHRAAGTPQTTSALRPAASSDHTGFARMGYIAVTLSFGVLGGWAAIAPLGSAAVAPGQVAVSSDRKPIQHLEGGMVAEILVKEAQRVQEGQVLFKLRPVEAQSSAEVTRKQLNGAVAKEARLLAEQQQLARIVFPDELLAQGSATADTRANQEKEFAERRRGLEGQVAIFQSRIEQSNSDIIGRLQREAALKQQLDSFRSEIANVTGLANKGFFPRNKLNALNRELWRTEGDLGLVQSEITRFRDVIAESRQQIAVTRQKQVEDATQQLGETRGRITELREKLAVAADILSRIDVRAPRSGIVQGIKVHAIGAVVKPGEALAEIVTLSDGLIMTAKVSPADIDTVHAGQTAEIRFPAFTSRQRTATSGRVETISADVMVDPNTKQSFYQARVVIDEATLPRELADKLVPGMPADVLIDTGERTVLQYLVGPLTDRIAKTMRDRQ